MSLALVIVACILFLLAAFNCPSGPRLSFVALGLFFWSLSTIWGKF